MDAKFAIPALSPQGLGKKYLQEILTPSVGDPLEMLMTYARSNNLRVLDLFVRLDVDKNCTISYEEFRVGIAVRVSFFFSFTVMRSGDVYVRCGS